jgi:hypothetical protein
MMIANGELGQGDEQAEQEHTDRMAEQWAGIPGTLVLSGGEDEELWFSWSSCDGCGTDLGGDRLSAARLA